MSDEEAKPKKRGRGPGKKPKLFGTSIRLPMNVMEYFNTHYPNTKQAKIREILTNFVSDQSQQTQGESNGPQENV